MTEFKSKHEKYTSRNPISVFLIKRFLRAIKDIVSGLEGIETVLDAGCGEGMVLSSLENGLSGKKVFAVDFDATEVESAKANVTYASCGQGNIYNLEFTSNSFDLVLCTEVLEHLERPHDALKELHRVSRKYCLITVPDEPLWRILNMARGAYITTWGNTPGHLNHWSPKSAQQLVGSHFTILKLKRSLPWTIMLCEKKI